MDIDLRSVEAFVEVVRLGSFTAAARELLLTQPTISARVANLEQTIGARLLERDRGGVVPTSAGNALLPHAHSLLRTRATAEQAMVDHLENTSLSLAIGASSVPGTYLLPKHLVAVRQRFPDLRTQLTVSDSDSTLELLRRREIELGLVGRRVRDRDFRASNVGSDEIALVCSPTVAGRLLGKKPPRGRRLRLDAASMTSLPFVLREGGSATRSIAIEELRRIGIGADDLDIVLELGSSEGIIQAVLAGLGATFVTSLALPDHLAANRLVRIDIDGLELVRPLTLVHRRGGSLSAPARELVRVINSRG